MGTRDRPRQGELMPGTLDLLILKTLSRREMHGYAIAQFIEGASDAVLKVEEGALYPALHRLEIRGWLRSEWRTTAHNRRAKFYRLSALGRREFERETSDWNRLSSAVTRVLEIT